ncbi:hypothetical protein RND71_029717 [Anisodus tanguticus]|uniref:AP2/ERF domain-containing protein n=1 Tax=Anisodus tanguticus TaxID=243964 RepID=A0AAE1RFR3_9SOLA|nr:hypothetical protein RND71_029717 [Anisodus tanguticus]
MTLEGNNQVLIFLTESSQKLKLWLGTFDRVEEAALAYDSAALLLRGRNAKTNFKNQEILKPNEEKCNLLEKNPRFYQLLKHAIMKKLAGKCQNNECVDQERNKEEICGVQLQFPGLRKTIPGDSSPGSSTLLSINRRICLNE